MEGGKVDPTTAYKIRLPSGRDIAAFFYDGPISRAIAFEKLLNSGVDVADRSVIAALFRDTDADALATAQQFVGNANRLGQLILLHRVAAGGTDPTTFKVRVGRDSSAVTCYVNRTNLNAALFGGALISRLVVREIRP